MDTARVTINGDTGILMHADNIEWADKMEDWKNDPNNKATAKPGDDRTPPWRWLGCLNTDDPENGIVTIPSEYIMRSIMGGAAEVPTGKGKKTFKAQSQSGLLCRDFHWPLLIDGKTIPMSEVMKMKKLETFAEHCDAAREFGFSLFIKRAKIGQAKHVRVRPRFDRWSTSGEIHIMDSQITKKVLATILAISGRTKGLGDWRPGSPTPGAFGMYTATVD